MAVTSNYLVVGAYWGGDYPDIDNLHYFDLTSGALTKSVNLGDEEVKQLSIVENSVNVGTASYASKSYYTVKLIKMDLASDDILWTFNPEYEADHTYIFENRSIAVDENGRAFCIIRKQHGVEPSNIYIINDDGTLSTTVPIPEDNPEIFNILIDKDNNFYSAIPTYAKYSPDGGRVWDFYTGTTVPNGNFRTGCLLGDNGYVYHAEDGGILNVNTEGEIAWAKYNETQFTKPGYPLLNNDGDMVVVGDLFVSCIKGDGAKIQDAPWPRVYQNNGNTSSR